MTHIYAPADGATAYGWHARSASWPPHPAAVSLWFSSLPPFDVTAPTPSFGGLKAFGPRSWRKDTFALLVKKKGGGVCVTGMVFKSNVVILRMRLLSISGLVTVKSPQMAVDFFNCLACSTCVHMFAKNTLLSNVCMDRYMYIYIYICVCIYLYMCVYIYYNIYPIIYIIICV